MNSVLSVRGPLLTVRSYDSLWVLRAGANPRAWKKTLDEKGNGTGEWQQGRGGRELAMLAYDSPVSFPILRLINLGEGVRNALRRRPPGTSSSIA